MRRPRSSSAVFMLVASLALLCEVTAREAGPSPSRITTQRLNELVSRGDPAALPELRKRFKEVQERADKLLLASSLVQLKDPDPAYWTYLAKEATAVVENDMPFPLVFDSHGQIVPGRMSAEFLSWCQTRHCNAEAAAGEAVYGLSTAVLALGAAEDPRGFDILTRGLESRNYFVAGRAAEGLVLLQDRRAIGPIIRAARRAPKAFGSVFGLALAYFDHPEAQVAAEELVENKTLLDSARRRARTHGPRGIHGLEP